MAQCKPTILREVTDFEVSIPRDRVLEPFQNRYRLLEHFARTHDFITAAFQYGHADLGDGTSL